MEPNARKVGVLGTGTMGAGIVQVASQAGRGPRVELPRTPTTSRAAGDSSCLRAYRGESRDGEVSFLVYGE